MLRGAAHIHTRTLSKQTCTHKLFTETERDTEGTPSYRGELLFLHTHTHHFPIGAGTTPNNSVTQFDVFKHSTTDTYAY